MLAVFFLLTSVVVVPFSTPWYLLWMFALEDVFGLGVIPYVSGIIVIVLAAVPLIDRKQFTDPRKRKAMIIRMLVLISIFISLMLLQPTGFVNWL